MGRQNGFEVVEAPPAKVGEVFVSFIVDSQMRRERAGGEGRRLVGPGFQLVGAGYTRRTSGQGPWLSDPDRTWTQRRTPVLPMDGIYATRALLDDGTKRACRHQHRGAAHVRRGARTIEAYLLDFDGSIYGRRLTLQFARRLRGEVAFDGVPELTDQIRKDVEETRALLGALP